MEIILNIFSCFNQNIIYLKANLHYNDLEFTNLNDRLNKETGKTSIKRKLINFGE